MPDGLPWSRLAPAVLMQPADEPGAVAGPVAGQPGIQHPVQLSQLAAPIYEARLETKSLPVTETSRAFH